MQRIKIRLFMEVTLALEPYTAAWRVVGREIQAVNELMKRLWLVGGRGRESRIGQYNGEGTLHCGIRSLHLWASSGKILRISPNLSNQVVDPDFTRKSGIKIYCVPSFSNKEKYRMLPLCALARSWHFSNTKKKIVAQWAQTQSSSTLRSQCLF